MCLIELDLRMIVAKTNKTHRVDIRMTAEVKALLQQAAASVHKNVSEFLLEQGLNAAVQTLADRRFFTLSPEQWEAFERILDRPPRAHRRLKKLLTEPGAFD